MSDYKEKVMIYQRPEHEIKCSGDWIDFKMENLPFEHV
jgi:hypothetical protein